MGEVDRWRRGRFNIILVDGMPEGETARGRELRLADRARREAGLPPLAPA